MRDPRKQAFQTYLRCLADKMGLRDWTVGIHDSPPDDGRHEAEADARYGLKTVWVYLSEYFLDLNEDRQRQTLVHELLHAHAAHMDHLLVRFLSDSETAAYKLAMEYMVDGIAEEWAKTLPLPSEVREAKPGPKPKTTTRRRVRKLR